MGSDRMLPYEKKAAATCAATASGGEIYMVFT